MDEALCGVCNSEPRKYKCPTCSVPYCSIPCFKEHKRFHPDPASTPASAPAPLELPQPPPPAPVPKYLRNKIDFSVLATNPKFKQLLLAHPTLMLQLQRVYAKTIEPEPDDFEPPRARCFRGRGRGRGQRGRGRAGGWRNENTPPKWTQKKGDADAMKMMKDHREGRKSDEEKEAMAAFVNLVDEMFGDGKGEKDDEDSHNLNTL